MEDSKPIRTRESDWPIEVRLCYQDVKTRMARMAQRNVKTARGHKVLDTQLGKLQLELDGAAGAACAGQAAHTASGAQIDMYTD